MAISELPKFSNSFRAGNPVTRVKRDRPKALAEVHRPLLFLQAFIPAFDLNIHESQTRRLPAIQLTQNKTYKGKVIKTHHSNAFQDQWQGGSSRAQSNTHLGRHLSLNEMIIIHDNVNVCRDTWLLWSHHINGKIKSLLCNLGRQSLYRTSSCQGNHPHPWRMIPASPHLGRALTVKGHYSPALHSMCTGRKIHSLGLPKYMGFYIHIYLIYNASPLKNSFTVIWHSIRDFKVLRIFQISDLVLYPLCKESSRESYKDKRNFSKVKRTRPRDTFIDCCSSS